MEIDNDNVQNTPQKEEIDKPLDKSESKRLESINRKIRAYRQQKLVIKAALSSVDSKLKNGVVLGENQSHDSYTIDDNTQSNQKKKILFDDDEDEDNDFSFPTKTQFEGAEGQKLLALQSKYKNDDRFKLDERFLNKEEEIQEDNENEEMSIEQEKLNEMKLLEEVLGNKVKLKKNATGENLNKRMLRFDPTQSDHSKYELENKEKTKREKKRKKTQEVENIEVDQPQVSKDVYYKVDENLKQALQGKENFSLLNLFGTTNGKESDEIEHQDVPVVEKNYSITDVPQYDSSDDEASPSVPEKQIANAQSRPENLWTEPFFFAEDDFRLQEGFDFLKRTSAAPESNFSQLRRDLRCIVKTKFRNNQRKGQPFKKKLGGNKRKKLIRIKKALKK